MTLDRLRRGLRPTAAAACPCCAATEVTLLREVESYEYFTCSRCGAIFIAPRHLDEIDGGRDLRRYDVDYWDEELPAARDRAYGVALARMAEAFHYATIPIHRFLDVGSGPGYFLDAVEKHLPASASRFYGVEKFPPPADRRTPSPRLLIGDLADLELRFDGGICIEVAEHLTPRTLRSLVRSLGRVSTAGALYLFNTGLPEYVLHEDPAYLDPVRRGHIMSYSPRSLEHLLEGLGVRVHPIRGKTWAFALEFGSASPAGEDITARVWSALPENVAVLDDPEMGSVLRILGRETVQAYR